MPPPSIAVFLTKPRNCSSEAPELNSRCVLRPSLESSREDGRCLTILARVYIGAHAGAFEWRKVQASFRPPPQNILGGQGEFLADEIIDFRLKEPRAKLHTEITARLAENHLCPRAIRAGQAGHSSGIEPRIFAAQRAQKLVEVAAFHVAAGQRRRRGPMLRARGLEIRRKPVDRIFRQAPVGGDLAAENRKQRRAALRRV